MTGQKKDGGTMYIAKRSKQTDNLCKFCKHIDTCPAWLLIKDKYDVIVCSKDPDKAKADIDAILKEQIKNHLGGYLKSETKV